eukprot:4319967-Pleurochrysis_carterae.AAC.1
MSARFHTPLITRASATRVLPQEIRQAMRDSVQVRARRAPQRRRSALDSLELDSSPRPRAPALA